MTRPPQLPPSASVAHDNGGAKLHAPAAARNSDALTRLLLDHAPRIGTALELASGTGQHICAFAAALPALHWTPSEPDTARRASIDAHVAEAGLKNVAPAAMLDATDPNWGAAHFPKDLIVLVNLLHLIPSNDARTLIEQAAAALAQGGTLILYGPFKRCGVLTSAGDAKFDAELRTADPAIGYKDDLDIARWLSDVALSPIDTVEMPANNLAFIAGKPPS
ncbi:Protein of unknown function [Sulfitobacter brevis]|uniref:Methyltransferase domain-containing protein n=1 Tax=Sulfitobacter brevis TaxID=74348 RepID=A0A1I2FIA4_9RHOB|nr:DUF938 domain-containing protein [Sulfitobacter brevis]SFF05214.1 Protein of unknown function [Sulfitobacter brevis]